MLTIGELARFAGVSTRAIRFYHRLGLMPEPPRDSSGYRRYDADDVVRLSRVVALASAGVPLARIGQMLAGDAESFERSLSEVDADLRAQIRQLRDLRRTLADLGSHDRLALPPELANSIEEIRRLGAPAKYVEVYRDSWILAYALYAEPVRQWLGKHRFHDDPVYMDLQVRMLRLADADPDDPGVDQLADDTVAWLDAHDEVSRSDDYASLFADDRLNRIMLEQWVMTPAWERLNQLVLERCQEEWGEALSGEVQS